MGITVDHRVGVTLPVDGRVAASDLVELARIAERAGLDTVSVGEVAATDAFCLAAALAMATSSIRVDVCATAVTTRSVPLLAMATATVAALAPERFVLTLGSGSESVAAWHGAAYRQPRTLMTQRVEELRSALTAERLPQWGGFRLSGSQPAAPPLFMAALNPAMVELAGRLCDGLVLTYVDPALAHDLAVPARAASAAPGRSGSFEVIATAFLSVGDDAAADAEAFKLGVAPYTAVRTYRHVLTSLADADAIDAAAVTWAREGRRAASRLVPDELVDRLLVRGEPDEVAARLADYHVAGVDTVRFIPVDASGRSRDAILRAIEKLDNEHARAAAAGGSARTRRRGTDQVG